MKPGAVVIGRNEGARLERCLASLQGRVEPLVYVDSGSVDGSVQAARDAGAEVVELTPDTPFTAARARGEGFERLLALGMPEIVQFVDGDCEVVEGWLQAGSKALIEDPKLGLVTGWRAEINRDISVYNALCDFEWHRPAGKITSCGGDMMVRSDAYLGAGGYRADVIAAEDDEFCLRLGKSGWELQRIAVDMTRHDAAMTRFSQWWKRAVRSGHGFAQVGALHPEFFVAERRRVWFYGAVLPVVALVGGSIWWPLAFIVSQIYLLSYVRTVLGLERAGLPVSQAAHQAFFLTLSKFPNLLGIITYHLRRMRGADMRIIEYK